MKNLNIHVITHVPYEGIGCIQNWINTKEHQLSFTKMYEDQLFPSNNQFDWLIVMGGPMSVYEEDIYPWLKAEKEFILKAINNGKVVLGICLGSQFIADVLGAKVYPNKIKEIGWLSVSKTGAHSISNSFPDTTTVFQWHGDTFDIPNKAQRLFESKVCPNQAFIYNDKVLALQFHYEATPSTIDEMLINGASELIPEDTVQTAEVIKQSAHLTVQNNDRMYNILDYLEQQSV